MRCFTQLRMGSLLLGNLITPVLWPAREIGEHDLFDQYVGRGIEPVEKAVQGGGRLLTVAHIMTMSLRNCRLAVLSACESGIPRQHGGGEMTGLPASLLIAGAQFAIASLWPVRDAAAALLMSSFYDTWEGGRGQRTQSLKRSCGRSKGVPYRRL